MLVWLYIRLFIISFIFGWISSECPNACNAHGKCGAYDMCECFRNWISNDCSQRLCQFGLAHIDTPKGNLDSSDGYLSSPDVEVVRNDAVYPFGTTEQYPQMTDSDATILQNTGHEYAECSAKGYCDRRLGECRCFPGYEGSACQYMACPDYLGQECAGHGVCMSASELAALDGGNIYEMWDQDITMGCACDPGYFGAACEQRACKVGFDPLFYEDTSSRRYANWTYVLYTTSPTAVITGNYSMLFYDHFDTRWPTVAIDAAATCSDITEALEGLPNSVIPHGSVRCVQWRDYNVISVEDEPIPFATNPYYGIKTTLAFPQNPGALRQPEFNVQLDGKRPTLFASEAGANPRFFVYPNGFSGELFEYFPDECIDVDVSILEYTATDGSEMYHYLGDLTPLEGRLLAQCLGDADGSSQTPSELTGSGRAKGQDYSWDYGNKFNPHMVRLVDRTSPQAEISTDLCPGSANSVRGGDASTSERVLCSPYMADVLRPPGFIVPLFYDTVSERYVLFTKPGRDFSQLTTFSVFTTQGYAQMVSDEAKVFTSIDRPYARTVYTTLSNTSNAALVGAGYTGYIDCETNTANVNGALDCIDKGDRAFFLDPSLNQRAFRSNPKYLNIYTVRKIYKKDPGRVAVLESYSTNSTGSNRIVLDMSINSQWNVAEQDEARAYLFRPPPLLTSPQPPTSALLQLGKGQGGFRYVSECSNRGVCDTTQGICECFAGFTGDDCSDQNNILA